MKDEKSLLIKMKAGDRNAFKQIFTHYYSLLVATAMRILKDQSLAKDVVQDVFFKIWNKRESLSFQGALIAYLKRAVINQSINKKKSNSRTQSEEFIPLTKVKEAIALENLAAQD